MSYTDPVREALEAEFPDAPITLLDQYTCLTLLRGQQVTVEDIHLVWSVWSSRFNWTHAWLKPLDEFPDAVRSEVEAMHRQYLDAIRKTAASVLDVPRETEDG